MSESTGRAEPRPTDAHATLGERMPATGERVIVTASAGAPPPPPATANTPAPLLTLPPLVPMKPAQNASPAMKALCKNVENIHRYLKERGGRATWG